MQPTSSRRRRSPLARYAPIIAVVVVVAVVAIALAVSGGKKKSPAVTTGGGTTSGNPASAVPIQYAAAKQAGTLANYTWQDHCDPATGLVAMPILDAAPCVPKFSGTNGGATDAPAITGDTIRIGYYIAKPDPVQDGLLKALNGDTSLEEVLRVVEMPRG